MGMIKVPVVAAEKKKRKERKRQSTRRPALMHVSHVQANGAQTCSAEVGDHAERPVHRFKTMMSPIQDSPLGLLRREAKLPSAA
jgi:predicted Ser/Thr protein kinase